MVIRKRIYNVDDMEAARDPRTEVPASHTVHFSVNGDEYAIDLNDENYAEFLLKFRPYKQAGRRLNRRGSRTQAERDRLAGIREWARSQGYDVKDRGRVPGRLIEEYEAAQAA